jgi:hypothetical protein
MRTELACGVGVGEFFQERIQLAPGEANFTATETQRIELADGLSALRLITR